MGNEKAIRIAAIVLLLGVVVVSYMQWGKGVDESTTPSTQQFKTPDELAGRTTDPGPATTMPAGAGWAAGQEGPEGSETVQPDGDGTMPAGAGWVEGELGPEGSENAAPSGEQGMPEGGGWAEGEQGPEGGERMMPDGEPASGTAVGLCWKKAEAGTKYDFDLSGSVATEGFPADKSGALHDYAVVAVDRPITDWSSGSIVKVHAITTGLDPQFSLKFSSKQKKLHLCVVWPATLEEFQGIRIAACLPKVIKGGSGADAKHGDIALKPLALQQQLLIVSGSDFRSGPPKAGLVRRRVSGGVEAQGVNAGAFMIAAAATPILDEQESQANPRAVRMTDGTGSFSLSYLAPSKEPLFVCAMALPKGTKMDKIQGIEGQGCTRVQVPAAGPGGVVDLKGVRIRVNAEKMPLAPHEQDHLSLVGRCSGDS